jgi:FixJ family two-component response regulator
VFVVDDDPSVRRALGRLLKSHGFGVELFATAQEFLERAEPHGPACAADGLACAVLDVQMPGVGGLDVQQALAVRNPCLPVIFITAHGDIPMTLRAMKAGAVDFLPKPFRDDDLLAAVREAVARHVQARQTAAARAALRQRADALSPRERQVMALVVSGMLNKEAGQRLGVCEKTVKAHRARVMRKMQAASLAELVRMTEKIGLESRQS